MSVATPQKFDVVVAGAGIVGAACTLAFAQAGFRVALVERHLAGSGATGAAMGHIVVMDDSEAQFVLTRRSQQLWQALSTTLPAGAEYETPGTLWIAADEEELAEAARKHQRLIERNVPSRLLSSRELAALEPNLRPVSSMPLALTPRPARPASRSGSARATSPLPIAIPVSFTINSLSSAT